MSPEASASVQPLLWGAASPKGDAVGGSGLPPPIPCVSGGTGQASQEAEGSGGSGLALQKPTGSAGSALPPQGSQRCGGSGSAAAAAFGSPETITRPGLQLLLWRCWLAPEAARQLRAHLEEEVRWQQSQVRVYGRLHPVPRLVAWHGDPGCTYRYSGQCHHPEPWTPLLQELRAALQEQLGCAFNSLLLNRYRSGADRMGWHADDEPELEPSDPIASLSLGASRTLRFRPKPLARRCGPLGPAAASSEPPARQNVAGALLDSADALDLPAVRSPGRIPDRRLAGRGDPPADLHEADPPWPAVAAAGAPGPAAAEPPRDGTPLAPFNLELHDGDLLLMACPTQQHWQHALPERRRERGERFNLTFRRIRLP